MITETIFENRFLFPAHAGMNRLATKIFGAARAVPRPCGDEPP